MIFGQLLTLQNSVYCSELHHNLLRVDKSNVFALYRSRSFFGFFKILFSSSEEEKEEAN